MNLRYLRSPISWKLRSAAADNSEQDRNHCKHQQKVDKIACKMHKKAEGPNDNQYYGNEIEDISHDIRFKLLSFIKVLLFKHFCVTSVSEYLAQKLYFYSPPCSPFSARLS